MKIQVGYTDSLIFHPRLQTEADAMIDGVVASAKGLFNFRQFKVEWVHSDGKTEPFGEFFLHPMPGCCGIAVSTGSYIEPHQRGQHNPSRWFHELKAKVAKHYGYSAMVMTTELKNIPEVVGSSRSGWKIHKTFTNSRTNHELGIGIKVL